MSTRDLPDNVVDLASFRTSKKVGNQTSGSERNSLFISHLDGIVKGSPHFKAPASSENFTDRIQRIRRSLEKINTLMAELKGDSDSKKAPKSVSESSENPSDKNPFLSRD